MWRPLVTSPIRPSARSTCFTERTRFRAKVASDVYVLKVLVFSDEKKTNEFLADPSLPSRTSVLRPF